MHLTPM